MAARQEASQLLQLPDPCLVAVLQCCSSDLVSLFSAARAHSRLHQAAVQALSTITVGRVRRQQQIDGLLLYCSRHGQHVDGIDISGNLFEDIRLSQLPNDLKLQSLKLAHMDLQLQPGSGFQGVARPGVPLKQLQLFYCELLDGADGLAAGLAMLPELQHLSITGKSQGAGWGLKFPTYALSALQQLTFLELATVEVQVPGQGGPALQPLQALTALADLRLSLRQAAAVLNHSMLLGAQHLTRLDLTYDPSSADLQLGTLATPTQLQHLKLVLYGSVEPAMVAHALSQLPALQQLTYLRFFCGKCEGPNPPAAVFSALTASSKLRHLDLNGCTLPAGVWQHVFPAGRQLPQLQSMDISAVTQPPARECAPAPEGTRLASCCPGLQFLNLQVLQYSAERLAPLQRLSMLHTLCVASSFARDVEAVTQLTGLRQLNLTVYSKAQGLLLQLTQLKQLTCLNFGTIVGGFRTVVCLKEEVSGQHKVPHSWQALRTCNSCYSH
jgi:hypothetical protein